MVLKSKPRFTYANVASTLALVIAIGGGGAATAAALTLPRNSVGSPQVINGSIRGVDIHNGTITGSKVAGGTLTGANIKAHSLGHGAFTTSPVGLVQGYVWNFNASPTLNTVVQIGTAASNPWSYNSAGGAITLDRTAIGAYSVNFVGLSFYPGNVQVTAYGPSTVECKVNSWGSSSAVVHCFDATGTVADSEFSLAVIK